MNALRLANLAAAAVLTGNELGTLAVVHPAVRELPFEAEVHAEQAITRRYGAVMPALMTTTLASGLAAAAGARGRERALLLAGTGSYAAMLAVTLTGNVPLNARTLAFDPSEGPAAWRAVRGRWERLHLARNALNLAGLGALLAAAGRGR
jgi:Domain of unknown function (DUF1772)